MGRVRDKLKLQNSPLSLVLCQVRFSPLMAMAEYMPKVQDQLRLKGYPINASAAVQEFQFGPQGQAAHNRTHWEFMTKDRRASVVVNEGFVVLQTTSYDDFETFLERLAVVVSTVDDAVGRLLIQRVGLRYVDAIVPRAGETWHAYVKEGLRGFESEVFKKGSELAFHQVVAETDAGTMLLRLYQNRESGVLPPDLAGGALKGLGAGAPKGELTTLVDIDHFHQCDDVEYDREMLESVSWKLKSASYSVFADEVVTAHALEVWR